MLLLVDMKKALVSLALLALCATAQAQFTFTKVDGKTVSSQKAPDYKWTFVPYPTERYTTWEKDRVKIYDVQYDGDGTEVTEVKEYYIYYVNFDPKNLDGSYLDGRKSFYYSFTLKGNKKMPFHTYWKRTTFGGMQEYVQIPFPSQKEADAFVSKVVDKGLEMALDLDYIAPPQLVIEKYGQSETDKPNPSSAPVNLKYAEITLVNDSNAEIKLAYKSSPTANSSRTINIAAKSSRYLKGDIGGQLYWMKLKPSGLYGIDKLAINIVAEMHETKVILAK
jgi:hypothetical protein